jgi:3-oxoadipate enol-lactonase
MTQASCTAATAIDGTRIAVTEAGEGEPILLLPGLGYGAWSFAPQVGALSAGARVLAVDNRGTGQSDKPNGPYSISQLADDAFAVLSQFEGAPAHVVGTSMGGYIAMMLALRYPRAVRSLVLVATTRGGAGSRGVPNETLRLWGGASALGPEDYARATMPASLSTEWLHEHPAEYEKILRLRLRYPTPYETWLAQFNACASFLHKGLPEGRIDQPVTIIHGTADRVVPYENAAHLTERLPQASVVTLEGAGHLCWIEEADRVNAIIQRTVTG